jgi:thiamine-monophosphate kinase
MASFSEFDFIDALPRQMGKGCSLGIGDDAALFGSPPWAISSDALSEGRHFLNTDEPEAIGKKTAAVNISDMAAMACEPRFMLLNLHLGSSWRDASKCDAFMKGFLSELARFNVSLIGGDTVSSESEGLHCSATVIGSPMAQTPVLRSGAKVGDVIAVSGPLGGSYPKRHLQVEPRVAFAKALVSAVNVHAMMDISDGLSQDIGHILDASRVGALLDLASIPLHQDTLDGEDLVQSALSDGEDFELLFTLSAQAFEKASKILPLFPIGRIVSGAGQLRARVDARAPYRPLERSGFRHDG